MKKYYILPDHCKWTETEAASAEAAYSTVGVWYDPGTRIAVIDAETGQANIFTRTLDAAGNLIEINREL